MEGNKMEVKEERKVPGWYWLTLLVGLVAAVMIAAAMVFFIDWVTAVPPGRW
jgi:hypothetical protein